VLFRSIELGDERAANIVMLGAIIARSGIVSMDTIMGVLEYAFSGSRARLLPLNQKALMACVN
jgi:2-oxoglutarate ferredoxin oxidoreductase subunit gamma